MTASLPPVRVAATARCSGFARGSSTSREVGIDYRYDCGERGDLFLGDTMGGGVGLIDFDRDGWLDIFVANGHVDDRPWDHRPMAQEPRLFRAVEDRTYELCPATRTPVFRTPRGGPGLGGGRPRQRWTRRLGRGPPRRPGRRAPQPHAGGHWLGLRLVGERSGRTPVGARVAYSAGGRTQTRWVTSGTNYLGADDPRLWFGLGRVRVVNRLEVRWPSGQVQAFSDVAADRILLLREGQELAAGDTSHGSR